MTRIIDTNFPDDLLPVDGFKAHLRLGSGFSTDDTQEPVLKAFLRAAISAIEARIGKALLVRGFEAPVTAWQQTRTLKLAISPIVGDVSVWSADSEIVSAANVDHGAHHSFVTLDGDVIGAGGDELTVRFQAGLAGVWSELPADLNQAVMLLATHYYEHREQTGLSNGCMPFGVTALIQRYREMRISLGATA